MNRSIQGPGEFYAGGRPASGAPRADEYVDKLIKLIPAEVVALWISLRSILAATHNVPAWLPWAVFGILLVLTPVYLHRVAKIGKSKQLALCTGAFAVWALSMGGAPFSQLPPPLYLPVYGAVLLPLYTFLVPLVGFD